MTVAVTVLLVACVALIAAVYQLGWVNGQIAAFGQAERDLDRLIAKAKERL